MRSALFLLAALAAASCSTKPPPAPRRPAGWDAVQTGMALLRENRPERAERAFHNAVLAARAADDEEGLALAAFHQGAALLLLDNPGSAGPLLRDAFQRAAPDSPLRPDAALLLADAALRAGDAEQARSWLDHAPDSSRKVLLSARLAARTGPPESFQRLASALPDADEDHLALKALAAARAGKHADALAVYLKAVSAARESGRIRLLPGLLADAAESAAALGRAPEAVSLATRAASAAYGQKRIPEAFQHLGRGTTLAEAIPDSPEAAALKRLFDELAETVNQAAGHRPSAPIPEPQPRQTP